MNIKHNPPRRSALIWGGMMVIGLFIIFLPGIIELEGFDGGYALSILGGFMGVVGLIAMLIYLQMAGILDRVTRPENVLAHWKYTPEEWSQYTQQEPQEESLGRRNLFLIIAIISIIVGAVFWLIVRDNALIIVLIILGIIAIAGITAWASGFASHRNNSQNPGEFYIALDGVYLNRQLHIWKGIGNQLGSIAFEVDSQGHPGILIEYSSPGRESRYFYNLRVPVPSGQEELARKLVADIAAAHLAKK
jgi:hypothetical protein